MLSPRTVYQRSERSALGRPTSWFRKQTRRGLNEVFLQFDVDNQGLLTLAKVKAMYMRYSPAADPPFARFCDQHDLLDFPRFVRLVDHEQRRGRFLDFEVASLSSDLMHESEQLKRAHDIDRLLARVDPRQPTPKAAIDELPKPLREPFKGIRMSTFFAGDLGKSLAAAVAEHKKQQDALDAAPVEPLSLPPVAPPPQSNSKSRRHRVTSPPSLAVGVEQKPEEDDAPSPKQQEQQQPPVHRRRRKRRKCRHKTKKRKRGGLPPVQEDAIHT